MPNLTALSDFAQARRHNLTGKLRHAQVVTLARTWVPEISFHERERLHPVDLPALLTVPSERFQNLPNTEKEEFRVNVHIATEFGGLGSPPRRIFEAFDPPVVQMPSEAGANRVLGSGSGVRDALDDLDLNGDGVYTYGHRLEAARKFFGATTLVKPDQELGPGNPRRPEHPIVVRAEMRVLFDTLKHELELDHLLSGLKKPIDAIWTGFEVEESFFRQEEGTSTFTREQKREFLAALINAHEDPDIEARTAAERVVLARIPAGWTFVQRAWTIVTEFAFLEFYLIYAFNDYKEYGTWPFDNEHEGDVEGCCVVFRRSALEDFAAGRKTAAEVIPHTVITSAHEEFNDADELKRLPEDPDRARVQLRVFVAPGSHATYITPGPHDILDFEDIATDLPGELPTGLLIALVGGGRVDLLVAAILFAGLLEKLVDSEDETSDDGVSIGPGPADEPNLKFDKRIEVTPLSDFQDGENIYQRQRRALLALRGFPGKWGGDDGFINKSAPWKNKTDRFFRKFLRRGQIDDPIL